jgi:hypothetical protein
MVLRRVCKDAMEPSSGNRQTKSAENPAVEEGILIVDRKEPSEVPKLAEP